jgi:excisionase family DNA binding protein
MTADVQLVLTVPSDLVDVLVRQVSEQMQPTETTSPWLDLPEAAEYLRTTVDSIRGMVKRKQLPFHKPNGRLLFNRHELDEWARSA